MVAEWRIASAILDHVGIETTGSPDREVCGLLLGRPGVVAAATSCRNVAADRRTRFEIDPAALLAAHRAARAGGLAVVGCYHSHPSGRAEPSPRDAADALPDGNLWLVAGCGGGGGGGAITGWVAIADGPLHGRFAPVRLRVVPAAAK